jgi:hypothetical protein
MLILKKQRKNNLHPSKEKFHGIKEKPVFFLKKHEEDGLKKEWDKHLR